MRTAYRALAGLVAIGVVAQAMSMVYAVAGLGKWVQDGGVMDKAAMESGDLSFTGAAGFMVHGIGGMIVIPLIALLLLIVAFFAKIPGGVRWAGAVLLLVVLQVALGIFGHEVPAIGALHGLNALALFSAAVYAARLARPVGAAVGDRSATITARA